MRRSNEQIFNNDFSCNWMCNSCVINTFPFQNVSDNEFNDLFTIHTEINCLSPNYVNALYNNIDNIEDVEMSINDSYIDEAS